MQHLGKDFVEACQWLSNESPTPSRTFGPPSLTLPNCSATNGQLPRGEEKKPKVPPRGDLGGVARYARYFQHPYLSPEARHFLFSERRLDERVVRWCRLTSWKDKRGVPWLQIPYYNREGELVGVQNRNLVKGGLPRFHFPQGSECGIYNLPILNLLQEGEPLYITEGCSDCWAMLSAGHKAIAIPSVTLLKPKDVTLLKSLYSPPLGEDGRGPRFHMYPDRDEPGERLFLQLKEKLPNLEHHQLPPDCKDFSEYYLQKHLHPPP